jgi:hypothetical protein
MKALVKLRAFELLTEVQGAETEPGGAERGLVEAFQVEQPQAPIGVVSAERNLAPSLGGVLDLRRHRPRPAGEDILVMSQHAGSRPRLFHNRPQELFREVGIGVSAEGDLRQTKKVRQRNLPRTRCAPPLGPGTPRRTAPGP